MPYEEQQWNTILPKYLLDAEKGRIKRGLAQFIDPAERGKEKVYENFYLVEQKNYFMQGDLLHSIKTIEWDFEKEDFYSAFTPAMLVSNSCDVSFENKRLLDKEAMFAPVIKLNEYFNELKGAGKSDDQIKSIHSKLKQQEYTNLFYLPADPVNGFEYIVFLDKIFWLPITEFHKKFDEIDKERFLSLSDWAFYLFVTKLALHFCRVPEEKER
jgi:hypothetical protein